jgi:hypothetical protein
MSTDGPQPTQGAPKKKKRQAGRLFFGVVFWSLVFFFFFFGGSLAPPAPPAYCFCSFLAVDTKTNKKLEKQPLTPNKKRKRRF